MNDNKGPIDMFSDHHLTDRICSRLAQNGSPRGWGEISVKDRKKGSAVLFLITPHRANCDRPAEPCLLLNKRSAQVLQPGDLCCPGGGVGRLDAIIAQFMRWPKSPLRKWPLWKQWQSDHPNAAVDLAKLLTTGLREGWEEMRLNPLGVMFLGCLPVQKLIMFERHIYPLVGWIGNQQNLVPNWEVDRIVYIPLRRLMDSKNYGRYNLSFNTRQGVSHRQEKFPCFVHQGQSGQEILWGATFRITMDFLKLVFGFDIPKLKQAPVIENQLGQTYLNGSIMADSVQRHREDENDF